MPGMWNGAHLSRESPLALAARHSWFSGIRIANAVGCCSCSSSNSVRYCRSTLICTELEEFEETSMKSTRRKLAMLLVLLCGGTIISIIFIRWIDPSLYGDSNYRSMFDSSLVDQAKRDGDAIMQAIGSYRAQQGKYPTSLEELVPRYLTQLLKPAAGNDRWAYWYSSDQARCELKFGTGPSYYPCWYVRSEKPGVWNADF